MPFEIPKSSGSPSWHKYEETRHSGNDMNPKGINVSIDKVEETLKGHIGDCDRMIGGTYDHKTQTLWIHTKIEESKIENKSSNNKRLRKYLDCTLYLYIL